VVLPWAIGLTFLSEVVSVDLLPAFGILPADPVDQGLFDLFIEVCISTLFSSLIVLGCFNTVLKYQRGEPVNLTTFILGALDGYFSMVFCSLLIFITVSIGSAILLVPGLILLTRLWVATSALYIEGKGVGEAMQRSNELTKGTSWSVFGVLIVLYGAFFTGFFVIDGYTSTWGGYAVQVIIAIGAGAFSFFMNVMALVGYQHLVRAKEGESQDSIQAVFE